MTFVFEEQSGYLSGFKVVNLGHVYFCIRIKSMYVQVHLKLECRGKDHLFQ